MATFLFVTASVAVVVGLVALVAGRTPWTTGHPQALAPLRRHAHGADGGMNRRGHARGKEVSPGHVIEPQTGP
jgi:hypothetical protein